MVQPGALGRERLAAALRVLAKSKADRAGQETEGEVDPVLVGALHEHLPAEHVGVPGLAALDVADSQPYVRKTGEFRHGPCLPPPGSRRPGRDSASCRPAVSSRPPPGSGWRMPATK